MPSTVRDWRTQREVEHFVFYANLTVPIELIQLAIDSILHSPTCTPEQADSLVPLFALKRQLEAIDRAKRDDSAESLERAMEHSVYSDRE